ncbi:MAG TPA: suppressor of fused domain protein [Chloroflexia bacterium]|nr:suppressor of fused domain protein [Chloroflexia bacterium]
MSEPAESTIELRRITTDEELRSAFSERDWQVLKHYVTNLNSRPSNFYVAEKMGAKVPGPIYILEFRLTVLGLPGVIYATCGVSAFPLTASPHKVRIELIAYNRESDLRVATHLAGMGAYSFRNNSFLDYNHTFDFRDGNGIIEGSALSSIVFAYPLLGGELDALKTIKFKDDTHAHLLWYLPVYPSERLYFKTNPADFFIQFARNRVDAADLYREEFIFTNSTDKESLVEDN